MLLKKLIIEVWERRSVRITDAVLQFSGSLNTNLLEGKKQHHRSVLGSNSVVTKFMTGGLGVVIFFILRFFFHVCIKLSFLLFCSLNASAVPVFYGKYIADKA